MWAAKRYFSPALVVVVRENGCGRRRKKYPGCSSQSGPTPLISVKANMILHFPSKLVFKRRRATALVESAQSEINK